MEYILFDLSCQDYKDNFRDFRETSRPSVCPICGNRHPLWCHGVYYRSLVILDGEPPVLDIPVPRYKCPSCRKTVSCLPSFCVPHKSFSAAVISLVLQLVIVCGKSLRHVSRSYPSVSRETAGNWLRQWSLGASGIVSVLLNSFGIPRQPGEVLSCHSSKYVTPECVEAFAGASDLALGYELTECDGMCDASGVGRCGERKCVGIIQGIQEKFSKLDFQVSLF